MFLLAQSPDPATQPIQIFGTRLVGFTPENLHKLLASLIFVIAVIIVHWLLRAIAKLVSRIHHTEKVVFWVRQAFSVLLAVVVLLGVLSIWFDNPTRLATFMGLVTAGVAFALQKPISALAGYIVILRGKTFSVGDRITMGGVRGDVVALRFTQTAIMEMGQPPPVQDADPAVWVHARQYTGRIVTVSNSTVFDTPVYNYTREFPYLWEEMHLPISFKDDWRKAEQILADTINRHTVKIQDLSEDALKELGRRYFMAPADIKTKIYMRITDNWIELSARFVATTHGVRDIKNAISRDLITALDEAKVGIASSTYDIVGMPPINVRLEANNSPLREGVGSS